MSLDLLPAPKVLSGPDDLPMGYLTLTKEVSAVGSTAVPLLLGSQPASTLSGNSRVSLKEL